jgi:filamentous hemagglutinin family protein
MTLRTRRRPDVLRLSAVALLGLPPLALANGGIATDSTLGKAPQTLSDGTESAVTIPESLGRTVGANLFHSFARFNINQGQTVTFAENTPGSLANVISRVTGGEASSIDGELVSTPGGQANFYFVNPAGVMFGPHASINVAGDFHVSTADYLKFKDGAVYSATDPGGSSLTAEAPAAFGFTGTSAANNGLLKLDQAQLTAKEGKTVDLVAGEIRMENGAAVTAPGGQVRLVARQGAGEDSVEADDDRNLPLPSTDEAKSSGGNITVSDSTVSTSGSGGGRIAAWGGDIKLVGSAGYSRITADNQDGTAPNKRSGVEIRGRTVTVERSGVSAGAAGTGAGGGVRVDATGDVRVSGEDELTAKGDEPGIHSDTSGEGNAGMVVVNAGGNVTVEKNGVLSSDSRGNGEAFAVGVNAGGKVAINGGTIRSRAGEQSSGANLAGFAMVTAQQDIEVTNGGAISVDTSGAAGNSYVSVESVNGNVWMNSGEISNGTSGAGAGGDLTVSAGRGVVLDEYSIISGASFGTGNAGNVSVTAGNGSVTLKNGSFIDSSTFGKGDAGTVSVSAKGGDVVLDNGRIYAQAESEYGSEGKSGAVHVEADGDVQLHNGGRIYANAINEENDSDKSVSVSAGRDVVLTGEESGIFAKTLGKADANPVSVHAGRDVKIASGSDIYGSTTGEGNASDVTVSAGRDITVEGKESKIQSNTQAGGNAGRVELEAAGNVTVRAQGLVSSDSEEGKGEAWSVTVTSTHGKVIVDGGTITAVSGTASGTSENSIAGIVFLSARQDVEVKNQGKVTIDTHGQAGNGYLNVASWNGDVRILNGGMLSSNAYGAGKGGYIDVSGKVVRLDQGTISAKAGAGSAGLVGYVRVNADKSLRLLNGSKISIANESGEQAKAPNHYSPGFVRVSASTIDLQNSTITSDSSKYNSQFRAGPIKVFCSERLTLRDGSKISTETWGGNGGRISINPIRSNQAGPLIQLIDSSFNTSVLGPVNGKGGNITINAKSLYTQTGAIQADTLAPRQKGGDITVTLPAGKAVTASDDIVLKGGDYPLPWQPYLLNGNFIQAAAPNGVSGFIQSTTPQLNLSGALANFAKPRFDARLVGEEYCTLGSGSTLVRSGRGGLPPKGDDLLLY